MTKKFPFFSTALAALIVFIIGYSVYQYYHKPAATPVNSDAIFKAQFADLAGVRQPLSQWRGKVLVVNFWATWCPPCRQEIPGFIHLQQQYGAQGLQIVGIALDEKTAVQAYADKIGINYPVLLGDLEAVVLSHDSGNYTGGLPYTVVINQQGKLVAAGVGGLKEQELTNLVVPLLQKH